MSNDYVQQMLEYIMGTQQAGVVPVVPADPRDDQTAAQRMNYNQDWLSVQADSSAAALAGPSAYSRNAFNPTSTYSIVDTPGYQQLMAYAARGTNTPEGFIAQEIMQGGTASSAIAALQQNYIRAAADGTLDAPENAVLRSIPMGAPDELGEVTPDWSGLTERMSAVEELYMTDPSSGGGQYFDPETGEMIDIGQRRTVIGPDGQPLLVDVETEPSEAAEWYSDQGLSQPSEQFTPGDLLPPEWSDNEQQSWAMQQAMMDLFNSEMHPETYNPPDTTSGKDQYADPGATYDKAGQFAEGTGFLEGQPLDLSGGRVEKAQPEQPRTDLQDYFDYQNGTLDSAASIEGRPDLQDYLDYQGAAGQYAGGEPQTWDPNGEFEQDWLGKVAAQGRGGESVEGFMGVGGAQQLDPETVAMVTMMANKMMLGGTEPAPPTPGTVDWSQAIPGAQYNEPGAMGPPMPGGGIPPGARDRTSDFEAQRAAQFAIPDSSSQRTGPEPSEGVPVNPTRDLDALTSMMPGWNQRGRYEGVFPGPPQTGVNPSDSVRSAQRDLDALTSMMPGWNQRGRYEGVFPGPPQTGVNPSDSVRSVQRDLDQPTSAIPGWNQRLATEGVQPEPSWWEQNMAPSWWDEAMDRGVGSDNDQQTRVAGRSQRTGGGQRPRMTSYKPPQRQTAELSRWRSDTQAAINSRRHDQQQNYGADFGRAAAIAYMLGQQGITPLSTQTAARRAVVK